MSIQTELTRITNAKSAIKTAIEGKGVTVPDGTLLDGMAALIESIEAGGGGVQPDWNQNDSTAADYVKNRPFYTAGLGETVLVEESTVSFANNRGVYMGELKSTFVPTVGETYKVYWDGAAYECACINSNDMLIIGNLSIAGMGDDTGEPFVINVPNDKKILIATADTSDSHTISISWLLRKVVEIDSKYIHPFNPNDQNVSGIPTPVKIYNNDDALFPTIGQTTIDQLTNKKAVFDYVFYDGTQLLRLMPFDVTEQEGTRIIEYTGVDTQGMRVCALEFCFNGSADDSVLTNINIKYPSAMYINSSTTGSTKKFKITVDDSGTISATEIV